MFLLLPKAELPVRAPQRVPSAMFTLSALLNVPLSGLLHQLAPPALGQADTTGILWG